MNTDLLQVLALASAGITVAAAGAALLVLKVIFSPGLAREIEDELKRNSRQC